MAKKLALGRGLSNLLPGADDGNGSIQISTNPDYQEIAIDEIEPNPEQPRKRFQQQELEELAQTIQAVGLIEPVVVRRVGERYQLISGERRWRACRQAGYRKIPAVIKSVSDVQALEMGIIENIQREELNPVEEARAYEQWMDRTGLKPSQLAERVGKDRSTITNLLRLLKFPPEVLTLIEEKKMSAGQARPLLSIGDKKMLLQFAGKIVNEGWSARRVEEEVSQVMEGSRPASTMESARRDPNIARVEERIRSKMTAKVQIVHKTSGAGKIILHYASLDDMERLMEIMGVKGS